MGCDVTERPDEVRLDAHAVETGIMMYLKEVRGIAFGWVERVLWPVYDTHGNKGAMVTLKGVSGERPADGPEGTPRQAPEGPD